MAGQPQRPFAVVTGASSGIGLELAKQFVDNGFDVLVTAEDAALAVAADALGESGAWVEHVQADLATFEGVEQVVAAIKAAARPIDAIALNAGVGSWGRFVETPLEDDLRLIALNVSSTVHLAKRVLPDMVSRGAGRVLITASIASLMPGPYYATYAASKSFVLSFAEALRFEVKDTGVTVTALLPGATETEFFERAGMQDTVVDQAKKDDPAQVAKEGFEALMAGEDHVVAGSAKNRIQATASRALFEEAKAALHARQTKAKDEE